MQTAPFYIFYVIASSILLTNLFMWRRALQMYDGINRGIIVAMWGFWRATSKVWMMYCLFIANIMMVAAVVVIRYLGIDFPSGLLLYGMIVTFSTLSWNLLPPTVLFLANSREESSLLAAEMQGFLLAKGLRIAFLLDPTVAAPVDGSRFYMDNFRTKDNLQWERVVRALMCAVPIIAIDVRVLSTGVIDEVALIFTNQLAHKTVFIVEPDGTSEILERLFPSLQARSLLLSCDAERVLEPVAMLIANIFRHRRPLQWER